MTLYDAWFIEELSQHGWTITVAWWHRMLRDQNFFTGAILDEIKLEDRLELPEGRISLATLYGEGD